MNRQYPEPEEVWMHPLARTTYKIHSRTDDGWTRFYSHNESLPFHDCYPLWTMPTDRFMNIYRKASQ